MRIISGKWRRLQIDAPPGQNTRPILDRAKTVLFDVLGHELALPGTLPPIAVLDLFAGSGTLGVEAVSRGARYCLCVEQHRPTARLIRKNLEHVKAGDEMAVVEGSASTIAFNPPPGEPPVYELVFVDPPYRMLEGTRPAPAIQDLLRRLATEPVIGDDAMIVVRHERRREGGADLSPLVEVDRRDVGKMTFRFCRPRADQADGGEA